MIIIIIVVNFSAFLFIFLFFIILVSQNLLSFFKKYLALSGSIGVARIFDWGVPKPQITCNGVIRNFETGIFCGSKNIVECKIKSRSLVLTRN